MKEYIYDNGKGIRQEKTTKWYNLFVRDVVELFEFYDVEYTTFIIDRILDTNLLGDFWIGKKEDMREEEIDGAYGYCDYGEMVYFISDTIKNKEFRTSIAIHEKLHLLLFALGVEIEEECNEAFINKLTAVYEYHMRENGILSVIDKRKHIQ